jgi:hypothetical protein
MLSLQLAGWQICTFFDIGSGPHRIGPPKIGGKPPNPKSIKEKSSGKAVKTFSRNYEIMLRRDSLGVLA